MSPVLARQDSRYRRYVWGSGVVLGVTALMCLLFQNKHSLGYCVAWVVLMTMIAAAVVAVPLAVADHYVLTRLSDLDSPPLEVTESIENDGVPNP